MARIELIEFLTLALLLNAAVILLVLRARRESRTRRAMSRSSAAFPVFGPVTAFPEAVTGPPDPQSSAGDAPRLERDSPSGSIVNSDASALPGWPAPDQTAWAERIRIETARCQRYRRPAAIVAMQLDGAEPIPADAASVLDGWLRSNSSGHVHDLARGSDLIQADGRGRFRALLVETDDAGARSYVERAAQVLGSMSGDRERPVQLVAGWAGSWSQSDLDAADRLAHARMIGSSEGWIRSDATWPS